MNCGRYEWCYIEHRPYGDFPAYTVPEGYYCVVGDNLANSHVSRADDVGPIARDQIVSHVQSVLFPFSAWRTIE